MAPSPSPATGLTITNPLVLYKSLLSSNKILPDPSQHRVAIHLQKLYHRLKDYDPEIDYSHRLNQLSRAIGTAPARVESDDVATRNGVLWGFKHHKQKKDSLALTRILTSHESAISLQTPQGLLLHGEVGTGKSMLIDLLADCLPNQKKRRWHFNTFMLEIFTMLEHLRKKREGLLGATLDQEYSLLWLARDMLSSSPILFLDEFQLPDRATSKILSNLMTSFFQLGGVLIATSNRMPEELANASGIEFALPPSSRLGLFGNRWGRLGPGNERERLPHMFAGKNDFAAFLEVLRARCEIWDMEGRKDWRRREDEIETAELESNVSGIAPKIGTNSPTLDPIAIGDHNDIRKNNSRLPKHYLIDVASSHPENNPDRDEHGLDASLLQALHDIPLQITRSEGIPWQTGSIRVYGRNLTIPRHHSGVTKWTFDELCRTNLGPADYISIASTFHTIILIDVPILNRTYTNEARRFITLLDALYEAKCKLHVRAAAEPDSILFPETEQQQEHPHNPSLPTSSASKPDETYAETISEIYQDQTSPFRPNVSPYTSSASPPSYPASFQRTARSILADEDSDFGPVYGAGRGALPRGPSDGPPGAGNEIGPTQPDFTRSSGIFTGEDERFAYKRARSRLWEMCSSRWWKDRGGPVEDWWRPVPVSVRRWETLATSAPSLSLSSAEEHVSAEQKGKRLLIAATRRTEQVSGSNNRDEEVFRHGASPFRTSAEPPPKFSWAHAWGMMRWGKKAGTWGKGVEGLEERGKKE